MSNFTPKSAKPGQREGIPQDTEAGAEWIKDIK